MKFLRFILIIFIISLTINIASAAPPNKPYFTNLPTSSITVPTNLVYNISNSVGVSNATHIFTQGNASSDFSDIIVVGNNDTANPISYSLNYTTWNGTSQIYINLTQLYNNIQIYYGTSTPNVNYPYKNNSNTTFRAWDNFSKPFVSSNWTFSGTGSASIVSGALQLTADSTLTYPFPQSSAGDITVMSKFQVPAGNPAGTNELNLQIRAGTTLASGLGWLYDKNTNTVYLYDNGAIKTSTPLVLNVGTWYESEMIIHPDFSTEVRIWQVGTTKPNVATLTFGAFSPASTGTNIQLSSGGTGGGTKQLFDDVVAIIETPNSYIVPWGAQSNTTFVDTYSNTYTNNQSLQFDSLTNFSINFTANMGNGVFANHMNWTVNGTLRQNNQTVTNSNFVWNFSVAGQTWVNLSVYNSTYNQYSNISWNVTARNYALELLTPLLSVYDILL